ncbi:UTRA domain-containing protein [Geobacter sp.]|uniref:UTRA domain-containing protein n=1 Tax=Geobacter sp. TaxID=46610 RepID=UPI0027BAAE6F|nr:UTRA domain-containing protein [Geobacter sp.]
MNDCDHQAFSFTKSADAFNKSVDGIVKKLTTKVLEATVRLPLSDKEHPFYSVEKAAQEALGLFADSPFILIERLRIFDKQPVAFHRAYLDPKRFHDPDNFLRSHDFETESLIDIYIKHGYEPVSRDTVLMARGANIYEKNMINLWIKKLQDETVELDDKFKSDKKTKLYDSNPIVRVILDAEQKLYASDTKTGERFVLEFLKASYLENWKYEIKNRPA